MKYQLFLFDLDDTLLDFRASEKLSFFRTLEQLGIREQQEALFKTYQVENQALWKLFEEAKTTKEHLKVERFRKTFHQHQVEIDPAKASLTYLDTLPETVVLIDHAVEICQQLSELAEIGIVTNGIEYVQERRIKNSAISPYLSFVAVSETCGHAKPDVRFFEYSVKMAKSFDKSRTLMVGDRLETDIQGAHNFGIDSCWFNPQELTTHLNPTYNIQTLRELQTLLT
jgi:2-haloacid dehalogenase